MKIAMANEIQKIELQINPVRLSEIINRAVVTTNEIVNFHFAALAAADLSLPVLPAGQAFQIQAPQLGAEARLAVHESWILAKAFQELLRAVRHSLEEAHVFVSLLTRPHKIRSNSTLAEFLKPFRSKAAGLKFPELLEAVNERLENKIDFSASYVSLQTARNCLEHRDGIVSAIETHGQPEFTLRFPRGKIYYVNGEGVEVELEPGVVVEPGDDRKEVQVYMRIETRGRLIPVGQRLTFSRAEFNEIAFACYLLGRQLSSRLPRPKVSPD